MLRKFKHIETPEGDSGTKSKRMRTDSNLYNTIPDNWADNDCTLFSEILLSNELTDATSNSKNKDDNYLENMEKVNDSFIQSSQKFFEDTIQKVQPKKCLHDCDIKLDLTKFYCEPIYETKDKIKIKPVNNTHSDEIQSVQNLSWNTQDFQNDEIIPEVSVKGPFYGLPQTVQLLIKEIKGISDLYDWQKECLQLPAIAKRTNLIYALPTSGGKTLVSEILMLREIICRQKNVIFVLPYVSIVQEKVSALAPFALNLNFLIEEYTAGKGKCPPLQRRRRNSIFIASIEKAAILFDSLIEAKRLDEIGMIVVDELHLIGEKNRGCALESLLSKVMFLKTKIQIISMSATIGNLSEISNFLEADVYTRGFRPVELKEFIKCGPDLLELNANGTCMENLFSFNRKVNFKYSSSVLKADPDHLAGLVAEVSPQESCLIFCATKKNCENVAILLTKVLPKPKFLEHKKNEKIDLLDAFVKLCNDLTPTLSETIPYGIAYHHSGLTTDERKLIEQGYRLGTLSIICCTSTLAAGVNLPAKRVIIRAPYVGKNFITLCQYKQMAGRAGRAGMGSGTGESILICSSKDNYQVGQMLYSPMDKAMSGLIHNNSTGLQTLLISGIGLEIAKSYSDIQKLLSSTLLSRQAEQLIETTIQQLILRNLKILLKHKIITSIDAPVKTIDYRKKSNLTDVITTQEVNELNKKDSSKCLILSRKSQFKLTTIGRAAFKAGLDFTKTEKIYYELKKSQESLVLRNYTHLLYLVVAFISTEHPEVVATNIEPTILFREYNNLDEDTKLLVKVVGIKESHIVKMLRNMSIKGPMEVELSRLYKVMILNDVLNLDSIHVIANKFSYERGSIQNLISQTVTGASMLIRLCEEIEEFWSFRALFERICDKLDKCSTTEIVPLLELPSVKTNRAKQLYNAGFETIADIAKSRPKQLVNSIEHLPYKTAKEIIAAAKLILLQKLETLQDETEAIMDCFK